MITTNETMIRASPVIRFQVKSSLLRTPKNTATKGMIKVFVLAARAEVFLIIILNRIILTALPKNPNKKT